MPFNLSVVIDRCVANGESDWAFPKNRSAGHAKAYNILLCCFRLSVVYHLTKELEIVVRISDNYFCLLACGGAKFF